MRTELVHLAPPAMLLRNTPEPTPPGEGSTNVDLLLYSVELELALDEANNDKAALRELLVKSPP